MRSNKGKRNAEFAYNNTFTGYLNGVMTSLSYGWKCEDINNIDRAALYRSLSTMQSYLMTNDMRNVRRVALVIHEEYLCKGKGKRHQKYYFLNQSIHRKLENLLYLLNRRIFTADDGAAHYKSWVNRQDTINLAGYGKVRTGLVIVGEHSGKDYIISDISHGKFRVLPTLPNGKPNYAEEPSRFMPASWLLTSFRKK